MKNPHLNKINYQNEKKQKFLLENNKSKTTNVNILLNRVRQEKRSNKKKIILLISLISILSFVSILAFVN